MNKVCLARRKVKMLIARLANIVVGLIIGIYSGLSLYFPLMRSYPFRWFPIVNCYINALQAISKFDNDKLKPAKRGYYDALDGSGEQYGIIDDKDKGFKELATSIRKAEMVNQSINSVILKKWSRPTWNIEKTNYLRR